MNESELDTVRITAALLAQGRLLHSASMFITAVAFLAILLIPMAPPIVGIAFLAFFLLELYLALRVAFDRGLFAQLADNALSTTRFDNAMLALELVPQSKTGREWVARCRGAIRLLRAQALVVIVQCTTLAALLLIRQ